VAGNYAAGITDLGDNGILDLQDRRHHRTR
jgi:hypothetical protein